MLGRGSPRPDGRERSRQVDVDEDPLRSAAPDSGSIEIAGRGEVTIEDPRHALALGIGWSARSRVLFLSLTSRKMSSSDKPKPSTSCRAVSFKRKRARSLPLAPRLPVTAKVSSLGMADMQVVEIARTLARGGQIIAFDEPTSSLTPAERDGLFDLIRNLKKGGRGIIYITHRIPEVYAITDRVTVLRDGQVVASRATSEVSPEELIDMIAGRRLADELMHPHGVGPQGKEALKLEGVSVAGKLHDINLTIHSGEIFGLAGLVGSGRTELARCIFGADPKDAGTIRVNGAAIEIRQPSDAKAANRPYRKTAANRHSCP